MASKAKNVAKIIANAMAAAWRAQLIVSTCEHARTVGVWLMCLHAFLIHERTIAVWLMASKQMVSCKMVSSNWHCACIHAYCQNMDNGNAHNMLYMFQMTALNLRCVWCTWEVQLIDVWGWKVLQFFVREYLHNERCWKQELLITCGISCFTCQLWYVQDAVATIYVWNCRISTSTLELVGVQLKPEFCTTILITQASTGSGRLAVKEVHVHLSCAYSSI